MNGIKVKTPILNKRLKFSTILKPKLKKSSNLSFELNLMF